MWNRKRRREFALLAAGGVALAVSLSACESIRSAAGISKEAPDEFAVVTKAPLIIPPDYHLKPPKPGAPPLNQVSPSQSAEAALYNDDPKTVAGSIAGNYSQGEKLLLAQTGAATASNSIRQQIAADNRGLDAADQSFTDQLLFSSSNNSDAPLNAEAEKARIGGDKSAATQRVQKKDSGGWLDGIF